MVVGVSLLRACRPELAARQSSIGLDCAVFYVPANTV